jgi:hypothetical protein
VCGAQGIVTVRLLKVWGLAVAPGTDSLSAYVRVSSSANKREWRSNVKTWSRAWHVSGGEAGGERLLSLLRLMVLLLLLSCC